MSRITIGYHGSLGLAVALAVLSTPAVAVELVAPEVRTFNLPPDMGGLAADPQAWVRVDFRHGPRRKGKKGKWRRW